jgi:hypothetical protein
MSHRNIYIPHTIQNCRDPHLKELGVAAFTKGTESEKRMAFSKCLLLEQQQNQNKTTDEKQKLFNSYLVYAMASQNILGFKVTQ